VVLEVFALKHDRCNTPVECPLPEPFRNVSALALTDLDSRKAVDAQVFPGHSQNFRAPQPVRLHPGKPYFCFAPMILGDFAIEPGKPYVSRYRYYLHTGEPDQAVNERIWNDYADPPQVVAR
jgi:hypothetical protein